MCQQNSPSQTSATRVSLLTFLFIVLLSAAAQAGGIPFFLSTWGKPGGGNGDLQSATSLATDNSGNVYVVDQNRVQKFDREGTFLLQWGSYGTGEGQFRNPLGIAIDEMNQVHVVDALNGNVQIFDDHGLFLGRFGTFSATPGNGEFYFATQAAINSDGRVYVTDQGNLSGFGNNVQVFDSLGQFSSSFGAFGTLDGLFQHPFGIDLDGQGNIYVVDSGNNRVQKFDSAGNFITSWGSAGSGQGQFLRPTGIAIDSDDRVYIADLLNHRIQVFTTAGDYDFEFGTSGTNGGEFTFPIDVAAGKAGDIYVADFGNSRIQRFAVADEIEIDLKPGGTNTINLNSNGLIIVALLTTSIADGDSVDFDATEVDPSTVMLGSATPKHSNGHTNDIDGDGDLDRFFHFRIPDIGLSCGDSTVQISGMTFSGDIFLGEDTVVTTNCS